MWRNIISPSLYAVLLTLVVLSSLPTSFAQVMTSDSYRIQSDSVNFGGGFSSSSSYVLESTAGEVATGVGTSTNFSLKAGYQQMLGVYIAISGVTNVDMAPSIPGVTGGTANGSTTVTVTTDSTSGYALTIEAVGSPAMTKGADSIADYVPGGGNPDFVFTTGAADAHFGFSPEGADVVSRFKDNGTNACGVGSFETPLTCWDGLSTTEQTIASASGSNHPQGATTSIKFRVGVGGSVVQPPGFYTATTTVTALPL